MLALYAMADPDGMKMITRDYIHYITSNSVLIGAEIDKVVSILTVTAIIAVAIARARHLLVRAVAEGAAVHDLLRFFAPEIAQQITAAEQKISVGEGQAREAAILFCDIRGFTVFANTVAPTDLMAALAEYQSRIVPIIRQHGGSIDKFMGDGIMATFGAAVTMDSLAADALRAVDDIVAEVDRWNTERADAGNPVLRVGAACAAGRIIFGAVGDETRLEYTVIGDAVNSAAKLEKQTKVEAVRALTDATTLQIAETRGFVAPEEIERRANRTVEGIDAPMDLVVLAK
jgi:adenylate cyclase